MSEKMMIASCPHCGNFESIAVKVWPTGAALDEHQAVTCENCGAQGPLFDGNADPADVIAAWNERGVSKRYPGMIYPIRNL